MQSKLKHQHGSSRRREGGATGEAQEGVEAYGGDLGHVLAVALLFTHARTFMDERRNYKRR